MEWYLPLLVGGYFSLLVVSVYCVLYLKDVLSPDRRLSSLGLLYWLRRGEEPDKQDLLFLGVRSGEREMKWGIVMFFLSFLVVTIVSLSFASYPWRGNWVSFVFGSLGSFSLVLGVCMWMRGRMFLLSLWEGEEGFYPLFDLVEERMRGRYRWVKKGEKGDKDNNEGKEKKEERRT